MPNHPTPHESSFAAWLLDGAERRRARLRRVWQMTAAERVAAMRRGDLTIEQLAAWSARFPDEVPRLNGEWEWLAVSMVEVCE